MAGRPRTKIIPPMGPKAFLKQFGQAPEILETLKTLGFEISEANLHSWRATGIPKKVYDALLVIVANEQKVDLLDYKGIIEVYKDGVAIGQFHLAKGIQVMIRRPKDRILKNDVLNNELEKRREEHERNKTDV